MHARARLGACLAALPSVLLLLVVVVPLLAPLANGNANATRPARARILGGFVVTPGVLPAQVAIVSWPRAMPLKAHCGGTLLSANFVLTAAHCVSRLGVSAIRVLPGFVSLADPTIGEANFVPLAEILVHENFDRATLEHDVALLRLARAIALVSGRVEQVLLSRDSPEAGTSVTASGWGATASDGSQPSTLLRAVDMLVQRHDVCTAAYAALGTAILANHMCTGERCVTDRDSCVGDSGGPLWGEAHAGAGLAQVALTSFGGDSSGRLCGDATYWAVNTRISPYVDWLRAREPALRLAPLGRPRVASTLFGGNDAACVAGGFAVVSDAPASGVFSQPLLLQGRVEINASLRAERSLALAALTGVTVSGTGVAVVELRLSLGRRSTLALAQDAIATPVVRCGELVLEPAATLALVVRASAPAPVAVSGAAVFDGVLNATLAPDVAWGNDSALPLVSYATYAGAFALVHVWQPLAGGEAAAGNGSTAVRPLVAHVAYSSNGCVLRAGPAPPAPSAGASRAGLSARARLALACAGAAAAAVLVAGSLAILWRQGRAAWCRGQPRATSAASASQRSQIELEPSASESSSTASAASKRSATSESSSL